jgi:hypothetical protein
MSSRAGDSEAMQRFSACSLTRCIVVAEGAGANMGVQYETIRAEVERVRNFITTDLDLIVTQELGGNYLVASLITCACDALSYLKHGHANQGELFFAELLPDCWKPVAGGLYDAVRNGIVHLYEAKTIVVGSRRLNVVISWRARPHMHLSPSDTDIYVNVWELAQDLKRAIAQFETDLKAQENLRNTFYEAMRKDRELYVQSNERQKWASALAKAPKAAT